MTLFEKEKDMVTIFDGVIIKVLGPGCKSCDTLSENIKLALLVTGIQATIEKVTDISDITSYDIISTPGLVINEKVMSAGKVLKPKEIIKMFEDMALPMPAYKNRAPNGGMDACFNNTCGLIETLNQNDKPVNQAAGEIGVFKGDVRTVSTQLSFGDILGAWKARWNIGRMGYTVEPGLYAVGNPDNESPVLVSANYKLSFDTLRKNLTSMDCWLLVLDTKGINVWCAAGKGTFGTPELVKRIIAVRLSEIVTHKKIILPQLSASGVSAHEVAQLTGFSVIYGPIRASDIKAFISTGNQATKQMRTMRFTLRDRLVLTPVELTNAAKATLSIFGVLFLISLFAARPFGIFDVAVYSGAVIMGSVLTPVLLPFIPVKAFSLKGWLLGLCWTIFAVWMCGWLSPDDWLLALGYLLLLPSVSAFLALNFTGCSTFTSPSGVIREMRIALPPIVGSSVIGAVLILIKSLVG